jgi:hypothetical protein
LAVDSEGNVYISELGTRVRKVTAATGIISTFAGNGVNSSASPGGVGDGGPATAAELSTDSMAVDGQNNLYIADTFYNRVRKVSAATGIITTIAGNGGSTDTGDNGLATSASLAGANAVALDSSGNVFVSTGTKIRKIDGTTGIITTYAGTGLGGYSGEGGLAIDASFTSAGLLAIGNSGNLLCLDLSDLRIFEIAKDTMKIQTVAGTSGAAGDGGAAEDAQFVWLTALAVDSYGDVYLGDAAAARVRKLSVSTGTISTVAGNGNHSSSGDGGLATNASLAGKDSYGNTALPLAVDLAGDLFILDLGRIRAVSAKTGIISTIAGGGALLGQIGDGSPATSADLSGAQDLAVDSANLYVLENDSTALTGLIRKIDLVTGVITTVATVQPSTYGRLALDTTGDFYFTTGYSVGKVAAGTTNGVIVVNVDGCIPGACQGTSYQPGFVLGDGGPAEHAKLFTSPGSVKTDSAGNLFIADTEDLRIRFVSAKTDIISTVAGTPAFGCSGSSGAATNAVFSQPSALALDKDGNVYVADSYCGQIFKLTLLPAYLGSLDTATCQVVSGWAADQNRLNRSINVSIYDGSTLIATIPANLARSDVGSYLGDNGMHGFSYTLPAALTGGAHSIHVEFDTSGTDIGGSPKALTCGVSANPSYAGNIDSATCTGISGWVADRSRLNTSITVSLWDGATQIASTTANASRADVGAVLGDNGLHGFSLQLPAAYKDGATHALQVHYESTGTEVGSPFNLTCGSPVATNYAGFIDAATCTGISGWVADRNRPNTSITVSLWDGATQIASTTASASRPDVGFYLSDNGLHGFSLQVPAAYKNAAAHTLQVHYESTASEVGQPFTLTCGSSTANYAGNIDSATCTGINGWVADRNRPNTSITVSLWDGATQIASTTANASRSDVGAYLSDNGLHGFSLQLPSAYKNGAAHTLQVHYESTSNEVGQPFSITCGSTNYLGFVDSASCSGINGWAADLDRLNIPITVSLWDGATQIAFITANSSRPDVGAAIGDNGVHGYSLQLPTAYANGASHTLQVHFESSSTQLTGSPVTLKCGSAPANYAGNVDILDCTTIAGWAADRNNLNTSVNVNIYDGSTLLTTVVAATSRPDVGTAIGDNGLHGFSLPTPSSLKDGALHTITMLPGSSQTPLPGAQSLTCH